MARRISIPPFVRFFRRSKPQAVELSRSVIAAIDGAFIMGRGHDENGPRVIVMFEGVNGGFRFTNEEAARHIARRFPELTSGEVAAATRRLAMLVRACIHAWANGRSDPSAPSPRRWMDAY